MTEEIKNKIAILQVYFKEFCNEMTQSEMRKIFKRFKSLGVTKVNQYNIDDLLNKKYEIVLTY